MRKINVDTDNRLAMTAAIRQHFMKHSEDFDPRSYLQDARVAIKRLCRERMEQFGETGMAAKVPSTTTGEMAHRYKTGYYGESAKPQHVG